MKKTLRLHYPQWQGGMNPNYVFGSELLAAIAPPSKTAEEVTVPVAKDFASASQPMGGIDKGAALLKQARAAKAILYEKQPDKVIVFGGDCAVTQVPFDYLSGKYNDKIGLLWLDAHPDCSTTKDTAHLHEMVLGNLLNSSPEAELTSVSYPYAPQKVLLAGIIEERLRPMDMACKELALAMASPEELAAGSQKVLSWIEREGIQFVAVHWDLDVLSPADFRSIYPAEPYTDPSLFPAAVGRMKLKEIVRLLTDVSEKAEIVGMSITEHLPWDAFRLRDALSQIHIFE